MFNSYAVRTDDMPAEMQALLRRYPRDEWEAHPGFRDKTRQWLSAHRGFRGLSDRVCGDTERFIDRNLDPADYAERLSYFGGRLVGNLHGHHSWEDRSYFPELAKADPRFETGLEILEQDHADLDLVLGDFTRLANRTIKLVQLSEPDARDEAGRLHTAAQAIEALLARHLSDEEDLAVPIILHHRLRG